MARAFRRLSGNSIIGFAAFLALTVTGLAAGPAVASNGSETVAISGQAYAFFGIDNTMPGAVVRIEEYPHLEAPVQEDGSYELEVPDGVNVTPYIVPAETYDPAIIGSLTPPPPYERVYNQTFRTSGEDLEKVHFQIPANAIYKVFIRMLGAEFTGPVGEERLKNCAIVTTFSMKEARAAAEFRPPSPRPPGYPETFRDVYPHGVPGSDGSMTPRPSSVDGPIFFAFEPTIAPDRTLSASTPDGGVLWTEVPPGYYWMEAENPDPSVEFAPFMARCTPGRLVNASPPWGFYELEGGAVPDPAVYAQRPDTSVSTSAARKATVLARGSRRVVSFALNPREAVTARMALLRGRARLAKPLVRDLEPGRTVLRVTTRARTRSFGARVVLTVTDEAGNSRTFIRKVRIGRR